MTRLNKKNTAVFVNNPDPSIGKFDDVFAAFSKAPEWNILIPLKIKSPEIKKYIKSYKLDGRIKYHEEYVPEDEYKSMLKKSHLAIMPELINKSSGDKIISSGFSYALAHNLPIITHSNYLRNAKKIPEGVYTFNNKKEIINILKNIGIHNTLKQNDNKKKLLEVHSKIDLYLEKI